jgi:hypothetical protein
MGEDLRNVAFGRGAEVFEIGRRAAGVFPFGS